MTKKIGLLVGREWSFPPAIVEEVKSRGGEFAVEYIKLATPRLEDPIQYSVILDRMSHEVPFYRAYLRHAASRGVRVVNPPESWANEDRFTIAALAKEAGIKVPRTVILPHREYAEGIVHEESLRNLDYPLDWRAVVAHVGLPCRLRGATRSGEPSYICHSLEELLHNYNASGQRLLIVEEVIPWNQFVRCFVIGGNEVLPIKYDPLERRYHVDHKHLTPELGERVVDESRRLSRLLKYDINTFDFAIKDGVPFAVEVMRPVPEIDIFALTSHYFDWVVKRLADLVISLAGGEGRGGLGAGSASSPPGAKGKASPTGKKARSGPKRPGDLAEELPSLSRDLPPTQL